MSASILVLDAFLSILTALIHTKRFNAFGRELLADLRGHTPHLTDCFCHVTILLLMSFAGRYNRFNEPGRINANPELMTPQPSPSLLLVSSYKT